MFYFDKYIVLQIYDCRL